MIRRFTKLSNHLSFNVIYQRHCIELDAKKVSYNLVDEIQNILSTTHCNLCNFTVHDCHCIKLNCK